jgi:hypothetical protein
VVKLSCLFILLLIFGCNQSRPIKNEAMREEIANREIKRISEAEIVNEAYTAGQNIAQVAEELLHNKSSDTIIYDDSTKLDLSYIVWVHNVDSLSKAFDAEVKIIGLSRPQKNASPMEAELLDAYQYNVEQNIELTDNIQKMERDHLLYTKPLFIRNTTCLRCHGNLDELNPTTLKFLQNNYSGSNITGYKLNEIIGMWSIMLSQKKIIQQL